ncbi:MAG: glycosyl transferase family 1 [Clostridia bacterium]|nr:glycosyl transferase family 1 [Clostridia bacterium]
MMNTKKKICFIAQFPPPIHGLSKAVDTLYRSELAEKYAFEAINITDNKKFPLNLFRMAKSDADLFYFTISQSRGGNLRDLAILKLLQLRKKKCVVHLHGGYYRTMVEGLPEQQKRANFAAVSRLAGAIVLGPSLKYIFRGMLPEERIFTVPNCVDDQYRMDDDAFAAKVQAAAGVPVRQVLYLSNFIRDKGYPHVLELARQEKCRVDGGAAPRFHFHFAGKFFDPADEADFFAFVRNHGLESLVTYHGVVQGAAKQRLLNESHILSC